MFNKFKKYLAYKKLSNYQDKILFENELQTRKKPYTEIEDTISAEQKAHKETKRKNKLPSQSKLLLLFLFINFTLLEGFVGFITIKTLTTALSMGLLPDFSPLITLISLVVGETISYGIYSAKSKAENTQGGIVYDIAMKNAELEQKRNEDGTFG